jgi:hypothetical protein
MNHIKTTNPISHLQRFGASQTPLMHESHFAGGNENQFEKKGDKRLSQLGAFVKPGQHPP